MGLKERLFGPAWESKDAEIRRQAVITERDPRLLSALPVIAHEDSDPGVRLAALQRMASESDWLKARLDGKDGSIHAAADHALVRRACESDAGDLLPKRLEWLGRLEASDTIRKLACSARDAGLRRAALQRVSAQGFLGDCLLTEPDPGIASEVLARIDQASTLKRIARDLRGRSKQRHHLLMQRLAELEGASGNHAARDEMALHLIQQAEQLARGEGKGNRAEALQKLVDEWAGLPEPDEGQRRRFDGAVAIVRSALRRAQEPAANPSPTTQAEPAVEAPKPELEALVQRAQQLATRPASEKTGPEVNGLMSEFDKAWNALRRPTEADRAARTHFMALAGELQARQQALQIAATAPAPSHEESDATAPRPPAFDYSELEQALATVDQALEAGDVSVAHQALGVARSIHDRLPKRQRRRDIDSQLTRMSARLKEMRDWQHWSNNKLRERLIERVGEIDAATLHPDAVTERLKELRERWKELEDQEALPGDKRKHAAPGGQWRRFQKACQEVFEQARPMLEKRSEVRKESLQELRDFLDDAERTCSRDDVDRDTLIRYQRASREALRNLSAIPPNKRGEMAGKLRQRMDAISALIDREFDAAESDKRRLVAEARKLAHEKDRAVAIDRAKALQAEWKRIGSGRRKTDQQLWQEFREPIDPLFEGLKQERERDRQVEHEHAEALRGLCDRADQLAKGDLQALEHAAGPIAGLEEEFGQHSRVPPALRKRFDQALQNWRKRLEQARREKKQDESAQIVALATSLQSAWVDRAAGKPVAANAAASAELDDASARPLSERLGRIADPDRALEVLQEEVAECTAGARQVVIEMECLAGVETPAEDKQQRMDYQIQRLSHRLGEGAPRTDLNTEFDALRLRWIKSFPHDPAVHARLKKRFDAAELILEQMTDR
jgi:hypothetical protein